MFRAQATAKPQPVISAGRASLPPTSCRMGPLGGAVLAALASAAHADTPPTTPTGLSATIYRNAGGELFWQRSSDDRGVRGYEVTRNGTSLGIFDALSLYDPSLQTETPYTFTVTAIDSAGQRSDTASVSIDDTGGATAGGPDAPANLSGRTYSGGTGELFRTRSSTPGLRYEIARDGTVVATTDGISYYTDALSAGTDYAWSVVAIDMDGNRSVASTTAFRTPGGTAPVPDSTPTAPAGLAAIAYSATAGELSWTRATAPGLRYDVSRDGTVVATTDGTSYFTDALTGATAYTWNVVAIAPDGTRSAPSTVA